MAYEHTIKLGTFNKYQEMLLMTVSLIRGYYNKNQSALVELGVVLWREYCLRNGKNPSKIAVSKKMCDKLMNDEDFLNAIIEKVGDMTKVDKIENLLVSFTNYVFEKNWRKIKNKADEINN